MNNVGESDSRNAEFREKFSRQKILQKLVGNAHPTILDIGAHFGESVLFLKSVFPEARIFSFEPDPDSFATLSAAAIGKAQCFEVAMSDNDGEATFYRNKISHTNSLYKVNTRSRDSIAISAANESSNQSFFADLNHEIVVPTVRLDTFIRQQAVEKIDLLKIDVQGAECAVLRGGIESLKRTRVVVLELSLFDYYEKRTTFLDVESILSPLGFSLFSISDISNNPMNGRTDWVEAVYLSEHCV